MATMSLGKFARSALLFSPIPLAAAGFITALNVFKPQNKAMVLILSALMAIFVMVYAGFLARRVQRRMDEVQLASQAFSTAHGWVWGMGVTTLLLVVPPVTNPLIDLANWMATGSTGTTSRASMLVAIAFGYMLVVVMQTVCIAVASMIWERRMSTPKL